MYVFCLNSLRVGLCGLRVLNFYSINGRVKQLCSKRAPEGQSNPRNCGRAADRYLKCPRTSGTCARRRRVPPMKTAGVEIRIRYQRVALLTTSLPSTHGRAGHRDIQCQSSQTGNIGFLWQAVSQLQPVNCYKWLQRKYAPLQTVKLKWCIFTLQLLPHFAAHTIRQSL